MATNDMSGTFCDWKEVSREMTPEELSNEECELMMSCEPSSDSPRFGPAPSQEHTPDMSENSSSSNEDGHGSENSSNDSDNALEQDSPNWGGQMAYIDIGPNDDGVSIHAELLKQKIPYFCQIFNASRLSFHTRFSELDPAGLGLLSGWIYGGSIAEQEKDTCRTTELFSLFSLASHFNLENLQDEAMECIVEEIRESLDESRFKPEHVEFAYDKTPSVSKLRLFCAGCVAEAMEEDNQFKWDRPQVAMLLAKLPELRLDINTPAINRFENVSTAENNTSCDNYQLTEFNNDIKPVEDQFGNDQSCGNQFNRHGSGSDEHESNEHVKKELDSFVDSGSELLSKKPESNEPQMPSPISERTEESGNNENLNSFDNGDEFGAAICRRLHLDTIENELSGESKIPVLGEIQTMLKET